MPDHKPVNPIWLPIFHHALISWRNRDSICFNVVFVSCLNTGWAFLPSRSTSAARCFWLHHIQPLSHSSGAQCQVKRTALPIRQQWESQHRTVLPLIMWSSIVSPNWGWADHKLSIRTSYNPTSDKPDCHFKVLRVEFKLLGPEYQDMIHLYCGDTQGPTEGISLHISEEMSSIVSFVFLAAVDPYQGWQCRLCWWRPGHREVER